MADQLEVLLDQINKKTNLLDRYYEDGLIDIGERDFLKALIRHNIHKGIININTLTLANAQADNALHLINRGVSITRMFRLGRLFSN